MTERRLPSSIAPVRSRLSWQRHLGLHLTAGALVLLLCAFLFGHIAEDVVTVDRITTVDLHVAQWFHTHATPPLNLFMLVVTHLHSAFGILALTASLAIYWCRIKAWDWLLTLFLTVAFGMALNVLLKTIFKRPRPSFDVPLLTLDSYSFPSGHASAATLFYGVLAAWLIGTTRSWRWRAVIAALTILWVALVGLSRIYLGVHYLSDVLAAVAASGGWLALSLMIVAIARQRRP